MPIIEQFKRLRQKELTVANLADTVRPCLRKERPKRSLKNNSKHVKITNTEVTNNVSHYSNYANKRTLK